MGNVSHLKGTPELAGLCLFEHWDVVIWLPPYCSYFVTTQPGETKEGK
jgi:hypothetical protein